MWDRDDLPWINAKALAAAGFTIRGMDTVTVGLYGGDGVRKRHLPAGGNRTGDCGEWRGSVEDTTQ